MTMTMYPKDLSRMLWPPHAAIESQEMQYIINLLGMQKHPEGGYYVETDRDPLRVPNPFDSSASTTRSASTTIYYLLTPQSPIGHFHRNKGRTVHTLHKGRGIYVIIHADEVKTGGKARVEAFVVGQNLQEGERLQWIVEGGKFKASFLLPDCDDDAEKQSQGLLISETVVPGFEFEDHDFMRGDTLEWLTTHTEAKDLSWLLLSQGY